MEKLTPFSRSPLFQKKYLLLSYELYANTGPATAAAKLQRMSIDPAYIRYLESSQQNAGRIFGFKVPYQF